ncbi:MAG: MMPL family transporter, partial [Deltaproteobacteria bacterium]|nr:MMPL family transporter [Deltaproteobacteria bacterium]
MSAYVQWLSRHTRLVLAVSAALVAASCWLIAFHLPLRPDFSALLPADAPSVLAARAMEQRVDAKDTMLMLVRAGDAGTRAAASAEAIEGARGIERELIERLEVDDAEAREFVRARQHLFVPLQTLVAAREALAARVTSAKAHANPLLVELDDTAAPAPTSKLDELRRGWDEASAKLSRSAFVSADGHLQVIVIRTAFRATDLARDRRLQSALDAISARVRARHPGVEIGFAGGIPASLAEHHALVRGMAWSSILSAVLIGLVLLVHLRSLRLLTLLSVNILAATLVSFGLAALTVGQLNAATAFLGAIIAGNGINAGILLCARLTEERARAAELPTAMTRAIAGTLRPTLVASLGAAVAYGALAVTQFRGFADFALIGGAGAVICWVASFTLLPALVLRWPPTPRPQDLPAFDFLAQRAFASTRPWLVCGAVALLSLVSAGICYRTAAHEPFETDLRQLRSRGADAELTRAWMHAADEAFGRGLAGVAGQTYVAVADAARVPELVGSLRELAWREPLVGKTTSLLDVVPEDQAHKLRVLEDLRRIIDADPRLRREAGPLRPPDDLRAITPQDLPPSILQRLTERDGHVGRIVAVRPGFAFEDWDGRHLIRFAAALREATPGALASGPSLLFADVLTAIQRDGARIT